MNKRILITENSDLNHYNNKISQNDFHSNEPCNIQVYVNIMVKSLSVPHVEVFKTTVQTNKDVDNLNIELNKILKDIKWNFDLEDCDKILRIESLNPKITLSVKNLLRSKGFKCVELNH